MSEPNAKDYALAQKYFDNEVQSDSEYEMLARLFAAYRGEIEARLAPAQAREDEAQIIEEYADYLYTLAGASVSSETDAKRKRFQSALAAFRSRQSPQSWPQIPDEFRFDSQLREAAGLLRNQWPEFAQSVEQAISEIKSLYARLRLAAAPQPSPQGADADKNAAWAVCRAEREPPEWTVAEAFNYREFFNLGYEARARLASLDAAKDGGRG